MKLRPFELALVVIFGVLFILALILLRGWQPESESGDNAPLLTEPVVIWGSLPPAAINTLLEEISSKNKEYTLVTYRYVSPQSFDQNFIQALADGKSPDLLLMSHEILVNHRNRLEPFPYETFPVRDFRSAYVDGAEIFALGDGVYGFPVAVDPLVMYWNRDIFSFSNLLSAPVTWEAVLNDIVPTLTTKDFNRSITQSALAMGEYDNVKNAFAIISMLTLQGGSQMVTEDKDKYTINLDEAGNGSRPFSNAVSFYTSFNNVSNTLYSWNQSLPLDRDTFLREELALYFGFGSEARDLKEKNPNLNFDIAQVPQGQGATAKRTYGRFYAYMVPVAAKNKAGAYVVMQELASQLNAKRLADDYGLAPVQRSLLTSGSNDLYGRVIYEAAPMARGWLNPVGSEVDSIFTRMLADTSSNRSEVTFAVSDALERLEKAY